MDRTQELAALASLLSEQVVRTARAQSIAIQEKDRADKAEARAKELEAKPLFQRIFGRR